jgi:hypothetical protein
MNNIPRNGGDFNFYIIVLIVRYIYLILMIKPLGFFLEEVHEKEKDNGWSSILWNIYSKVEDWLKSIDQRYAQWEVRDSWVMRGH